MKQLPGSLSVIIQHYTDQHTEVRKRCLSVKGSELRSTYKVISEKKKKKHNNLRLHLGSCVLALKLWLLFHSLPSQLSPHS